MSIESKDIAHVAKLARLRFSETELAGFTQQINSIMTYVAKLEELNTDNVQPLAHVLDTQNVMRPDEAKGQKPDPILFENAPALRDSLFEVPKILE